MRLKDHESHKWRYSDSSYYDAVCEVCNVAEGTRAAGHPCGDLPDLPKVEIVFPGYEKGSNPELDERLKKLEHSLAEEIEKELLKEEK